MEDTIKASLPNFVKITTISGGKEKGDWVETKARINPYHITSYFETFVTNYKGEDVKKCVGFYVGSYPFVVDMTIEEADEMIENIDRSLSFKENG